MYALPDNLNIFKYYGEIDKIKIENVKKQATYFLSQFQNMLFLIKDKISFSGSLPSLSFVISDNGSLLIEWVFKDFRMGFAFEENEKESSWYFASNEKFDYSHSSGSINGNTFYELLYNLLYFVFENV